MATLIELRCLAPSLPGQTAKTNCEMTEKPTIQTAMNNSQNWSSKAAGFLRWKMKMYLVTTIPSMKRSI